jgi:hypothetical protein
MKYDDQAMIDYCREQGWQIFYEEWTDAIGHLPCSSLGAMVYLVRDSNWRIRGYSQLSRKDAFRNAYEQAIQQKADKVQAVEIIKEVIDTSKARIKALEDVLRTILSGGFGIPGGYKDYIHDSERFNPETEKDHFRVSCNYCTQAWWNDESEAHDLTCPIHMARELLGDADES